MELTYTYHSDRKFPHWIDFSKTAPEGGRLDVPSQMDINQWAGEHFGELGVSWGFYYELPPIGHNLLTDPYLYSWRFLNKEDAMLFKLTWS